MFWFVCFLSGCDQLPSKLQRYDYYSNSISFTSIEQTYRAKIDKEINHVWYSQSIAECRHERRQQRSNVLLNARRTGIDKCLKWRRVWFPKHCQHQQQHSKQQQQQQQQSEHLGIERFKWFHHYPHCSFLFCRCLRLRLFNMLFRLWLPPIETFTIDEAVEKMGFGRFQMRLSMLTGLAWVCKPLQRRNETHSRQIVHSSRIWSHLFVVGV